MGRGKKWYRKQFKELKRTTHGHELSGGNAGGLGGAGQRGDKGGEIGKTNSIINKIYLKNIGLKSSHHKKKIV